MSSPDPSAKMVDVFSDIERETALAANPAGYAVTELAALDPRVVTLTADLSNTLAEFREKFPRRYIELGIAETNSVSFAAGLAACGLMPYIFSMAPFGVLKTAEQLRTDVDYNHLPVRLVGRLSGLAMGYFGTSHYAVEDIAIARTLNNTVVVAPADAASTVALMRLVATVDAPAYIRIAEDPPPAYAQPPAPEFGQWPRLTTGSDVTIAAHGMGVGLAVRAASLLAERDGVQAEVLDAAFLKPFDSRALLRSAAKTGKVLTVEDHSIVGGLCSLVAEAVASHRVPAEVAQLALPAADLEVGVPAELYEHYGLTVEGVARKALALARGEATR
ncbi:MAG TPA: transketolase C-terminal domain-containing protein [Trebonia sp.]|nr:transketolase C-terminal domain-containing protein [Trebonia sp.]